MSRWHSATTARPGGRTSWRYVPQYRVTPQVLGWLALGALLFVSFGILLGAAWMTQALRPRLRRQAEERRRLNQEWVAVREACLSLERCPRCGCPLVRWNGYFGVLPDDALDDD